MQNKKDNTAASQWEVVENFLANTFEFRFNEVANKIEYRSRADKKAKFEEVNENDIYRFLKIKKIDFSIANLKAMLGSSFVETYDPIKEYFEKLKEYDPNKENDYITALASYLPVSNEDVEVLQRHLKKALVRMYACSVHGVINKQAFVIAHDQQNSGKTTFLRWLCPPSLENYIAENIQTDKDSLIAMTTNFIINMDELATLSRMEINSLKSVMTKDVFKGRLPYAARETRLIRRANFVGSTNNIEFLNDHTGTVRWIVFELKDRINFDYKKDFDINRIWAQAKYLYSQKFNFELTIEEIKENEERNRKHMITSIEEELINAYYLPSTAKIQDIVKDNFFSTATEIKQYLAFAAPTEKTNINNIGKALKMLGYNKVTVRRPGMPYAIKGYYIVKRVIHN